MAEPNPSWIRQIRERIRKWIAAKFEDIRITGSQLTAIIVVLLAATLAVAFGRVQGTITEFIGLITVIVTMIGLIVMAGFKQVSQWLRGGEAWRRYRLRKASISDGAATSQKEQSHGHKRGGADSQLSILKILLYVLGLIDHVLVVYVAPFAGAPAQESGQNRSSLSQFAVRAGLVLLFLSVLFLLFHDNPAGQGLAFIGALFLLSMVHRSQFLKKKGKLSIRVRRSWYLIVVFLLPVFTGLFLIGEPMAPYCTALGFLVVVSMLRRWHWFEDDRELFAQISSSHKEDDEIYKLLSIDGRNHNPMSMALASVASLPLLMALALMQIEPMTDSFHISGDIDPQSKSGFFSWLGFVGAELAKAIPFIDWADIFGIETGTAIRVEDRAGGGSPSTAEYSVFVIRALFDIFLIATIAQGFDRFNRRSQQKLLLKERKINRLDPVLEQEEFASWLKTDLNNLPTYDPKRLQSLARYHPDDEIERNAKILVILRGLLDGLSDEEKKNWPSDVGEYLKQSPELQALFKRLKGTTMLEAKAAILDITKHLIEEREKFLDEAAGLLYHPDFPRTVAAIEAIGSSGYDGIDLSGLRSHLRNSSDETKIATARSVGQLGTNQLTEDLYLLLKDRKADSDLRGEAALALGLTGDTRHSMSFWRMRLLPWNRSFRQSLTLALGQLEKLFFIRSLKRLLHKRHDEDVRAYAAFLVGLHNHHPSTGKLRCIIWREPNSDELRMYALLAFLRLSAKRGRLDFTSNFKLRFLFLTPLLYSRYERRNMLGILALGKRSRAGFDLGIVRFLDRTCLVRKMKPDKSFDVRVIAASALGDLGSKRASRPLAAALKKQEDPRVVVAAARSLGQIGASKVGRKALVQLVEQNKIPNYGNILTLAVQRSARDDQKHYVEWSDLTEKDQAIVEQRWTAILALAHLDNTSPRSYLLRQIENERQWDCAPHWIREEALWLLGSLKTSPITQATNRIEYIAENDPVARVRGTAAYAIGSMSTDTPPPILTHMLESKFAIERIGAVRGLAESGLTEEIGRLTRLRSKDPVLHVRKTANIAVELLTGKREGREDWASGLQQFTRTPSPYDDKIGKPHAGYSRLYADRDSVLRYYHDWGI